MANVQVKLEFIVTSLPQDTKEVLLISGDYREKYADKRKEAPLSPNKEKTVWKTTRMLTMQLGNDGQLKIDEKNLEIKIRARKNKNKKKKQEKTDEIQIMEISLKKTDVNENMLHFCLHVNFDTQNIEVEPILCYCLFPTNSVKKFFCSLSHLLDCTEKDEEKFVKCLVPMFTLKGKYDARCASSDPSTLHNIWGDGNLNNNESAIQRINKKSKELGAEARDFIVRLLNQEYHRRENLIFEHFKKNKNFRFEKYDKEETFKPKSGSYEEEVMNLGQQVEIESEDQVKFLCGHAHAIIRGRLEAFSASQNLNLMSEEADASMRNHMEVAGAWFVFFVCVFLKHTRTVNIENIKEIVSSPNRDPETPQQIQLAALDEKVDKNLMIEKLTAFRLSPRDIVPREIVLQYFYSISAANCDTTVSIEDIKKNYAQHLVPQLRKDGHYDNNFLANKEKMFSKLYAAHPDFKDPQYPKTSAYIEIQKSESDRELVQWRLKTKIEERQKYLSLLKSKHRINWRGLIVRGQLEYVTTLKMDLFDAAALNEWKSAIREAGNSFLELMIDKEDLISGDLCEESF